MQYIVQELGQADLQQVARDRLMALLRIQPQNERALFNLAMITMDEVIALKLFVSEDFLLELHKLFGSINLVFHSYLKYKCVVFSLNTVIAILGLSG